MFELRFAACGITEFMKSISDESCKAFRCVLESSTGTPTAALVLSAICFGTLFSVIVTPEELPKP